MNKRYTHASLVGRSFLLSDWQAKKFVCYTPAWIYIELIKKNPINYLCKQDSFT